MRRLLALWAVMLLCPLAGCQAPGAVDVPPQASPELSQNSPSSSPLPDQAPSPAPTAVPQQETPSEPRPGPSDEPQSELSDEPQPDPSTEPQPEPEDADFVLVSDYVPNLRVQLPYATPDNFTGQVIYDFQDAWLRYGTAKKLSAAAQALAEEGYALLIWDAFRPTWAQFKLWEVCPDPTFVADPTKGFSSHSRGNTVDVTLVLLDGTPVEMPSGFDEFSSLADRDYSDVPDPAAAHARLLEDVMESCGFHGYSGEWWHFRDTDSYPVEEEFTPPGA